MKTASVADFKARLSEFITAAKSGEEVIVTDRGRPVAKLTGLSGESKRNSGLEKMIRDGLIRPPTAKLPADFFDRPRPVVPDDSVSRAIDEDREESF